MKTAALAAHLNIALCLTPAALAQPTLIHHLVGDDTVSRDWFGYSAAIDGDLAVIGNVGDTENGGASGSAHVFDLATGNQLAKLLPSHGNVGQWFGLSCDIDGDTVIVGAYADSEYGNRAGAAYLFDANTGQQLHKLVSDNLTDNHYLGASVAIDGQYAVAGAYNENIYGPRSGAAYVFDVSTGQQLHRIIPADGAEEDHFARFVAIDNGIIAISAAYADDAASNAGKIYIYDAATAQLLRTFTANDPTDNQVLGFGLDLDDGLVLAGSPWKGDAGTRSGAAYLFDANTGSQLRKITADDASAYAYFGFDVAIHNDRALIGAWGEATNGSNAGAAYAVDLLLNQQTRILPADNEEDDRLGHCVALQGDTAIIGAYRDDLVGHESGSAYVYELAHTCRADIDGDGSVTTQDFLAFLNAWNAQEPVADWNSDGSWDTQDFLAFLNAWSAGCP